MQWSMYVHQRADLACETMQSLRPQRPNAGCKHTIVMIFTNHKNSAYEQQMQVWGGHCTTTLTRGNGLNAVKGSTCKLSGTLARQPHRAGPPQRRSVAHTAQHSLHPRLESVRVAQKLWIYRYHLQPHRMCHSVKPISGELQVLL